MLTQLKEYGVREPIISQGAFTANYVLDSVKDGALGILTAKHYSDVLETSENRRFVTGFLNKHKVRPDAWSEQAYVGVKAVGEAIKAIAGRVEERQRFLDAFRKANFEAPARWVSFDGNQQRVFDVYIRKVERSGNDYVNQVVDKIPHVSQSWSP